MVRDVDASGAAHARSFMDGDQIGVRAAVVCMLVFFAACSRPRSAPQYVDAGTCAGCHPKIAATYSKTGMARAFYSPRREHVKDARFFQQSSGLNFEIVEREGKFFQRRWE